jgi:hypothetical protein
LDVRPAHGEWCRELSNAEPASLVWRQCVDDRRDRERGRLRKSAGSIRIPTANVVEDEIGILTAVAVLDAKRWLSCSERPLSQDDEKRGRASCFDQPPRPVARNRQMAVDWYFEVDHSERISSAEWLFRHKHKPARLEKHPDWSLPVRHNLIIRNALPRLQAAALLRIAAAALNAGLA